MSDLKAGAKRPRRDRVDPDRIVEPGDDVRNFGRGAVAAVRVPGTIPYASRVAAHRPGDGSACPA